MRTNSILFAVASIILLSGSLIGNLISFHESLSANNMVVENTSGESYGKIFIAIEGEIHYLTSTGFGILGPVWSSSEKHFLLGGNFYESNWIKVKIAKSWNLVPLEPGGEFSLPVNVTIHQLVREKVGPYVIKAAGISLCFGVALQKEKYFPGDLLRYIEVSSQPISIKIHKEVRWGIFVVGVRNYTIEVFPSIHNSLKYSWHWGKFLMIGEWGKESSGFPIYNGTIRFSYPPLLKGKAITRYIRAVYYFSAESQRELREYENGGLQLCVIVQLGWWVISPDGKKVGEITVTEPILLERNLSVEGKGVQEFQIKLIGNGDLSDPAYAFEGGEYTVTVEVGNYRE